MRPAHAPRPAVRSDPPPPTTLRRRDGRARTRRSARPRKRATTRLKRRLFRHRLPELSRYADAKTTDAKHRAKVRGYILDAPSDKSFAPMARLIKGLDTKLIHAGEPEPLIAGAVTM